MADRIANGESRQGATFLAEARAAIVARFDDETRAAHDEWIAWMKGVGAGGQALRTGDRLPDFLLPDADGRLASPRDLLELGPLVMLFILGDWCPFSLAQLRGYEQRMGEFRRLGVLVVAVTPDTNGYPRRLMRKAELEAVRVLSDIDYGLSLACGLISAIPAAGHGELGRRAVNLSQRHGTPVPMLPIPVTYVVDKRGMISLDHIDPDFTQRAEPDAVLAHLRGIA